MELPGYSLDLEPVITEIKTKRYSTIVLQLPEGLKRNTTTLTDLLQKETHAKVLVSADPCFGACDLITNELASLHADALIHIGHTPIPSMQTTQIPTLFVNARSTQDVSPVIHKALPALKGKRIGLVTTAQHLHTLPVAEAILKKNNYEPLIAQGDKRIAQPGQLLGCNFSAATTIIQHADSYLFIGSGTFHPVGLLLSTKKPVIAADPYTNTIKTQELEDMKDAILRQRYGAIVAAKNARRIGIIIGTKPGQQRLTRALELQTMLTTHNKKSVLLLSNLFSSDSLQGFADIDCFVSTACPRIAIDDYTLYKKPLITPVELEITLGKKTWDDYVFDEIQQ